MYSIPFVICSAPKDYLKLPYVIRGLIDHYTGVCEIFLVTPDVIPDNIKENIKSIFDKVSYVLDSELPIDKSRINFRSPGWITQQFVKLLAERIIFPNKGYRVWGVIDADTILNRPISNSSDTGGEIFYHTKYQRHQPYFDFITKYLNTDINLNSIYSYIAEIMIFKKSYIDALIGDTNKFLEFCYNNINNECYLSEYELYGHYVRYCYNHINVDNNDYYIDHKFLAAAPFSKINQDWTTEEIEMVLKLGLECDMININSIRW